MEDLNSEQRNHYHLVVIHPFGAYQRGAVISDADEVADVLAGENLSHVNKIKGD